MTLVGTRRIRYTIHNQIRCVIGNLTRGLDGTAWTRHSVESSKMIRNRHMWEPYFFVGSRLCLQ